jgi:membrane-bound lytic murein transglycosylase D
LRRAEEAGFAIAAGFKRVPVLGALRGRELDAPLPLKKLGRLESSSFELSSASDAPLIFDIPIAYNHRVKRWIEYFQTSGRSSFKRWLERSARYLPVISYELEAAGMPQDLAYVAMIESGFQPEAASGASAVGLWQFMAGTGSRYGLRVSWWLDERRDFVKSTRAAIGYMADLYKIFGSWYLVAASYNMGESAIARMIKRHGTNDFWRLADSGALPEETKNYVPKMLAATLISKAPALYGFRDLNYLMPHSFDWFLAPGGTSLSNLADYLGVSPRYMRDLNPELTRGFIPREARGHNIRVPKGATLAAARFARDIGSAVTMRN